MPRIRILSPTQEVIEIGMPFHLSGVLRQNTYECCQNSYPF